jgi:acyl carrier protein
MTNKEKYDEAFTSSLDVSADQLSGLTYQGIKSWDSVGHMTLISALEEAFDIMLDTDDILDLSSYENGMEILSKGEYGIEF